MVPETGRGATTVKIVKKYSNRRLYDTDQSKYVTLGELAELIREGHDVKVVDASTDEDLTQAILARIVVESRGAARLLPVPLLTQMIRMEEDALAEFMQLYMSWALDVYFQVKRGFRDLSPYQLFGGQGGGFPFSPGQAWGRLFGQNAPWKKGRDGAPRGRQEPDISSDPPEEPVEERPPEEGTAKGQETADMKALQEQIASLSARIDDMSKDNKEE